jgi:UDP-N-acetylmuramyl tripeptide synthase
VCNLDDPCGRELAALTTATKVVGYTQRELPADRQATICAENVEETIAGLRFRLGAPSGRAEVETGVLGRYNVSNLLAVAAVLLDAGLTAREVAERFARLTAPAGRLERIGGDNEPLVVVDYAHTPDALESALRALRPVATARGAG